MKPEYLKRKIPFKKRWLLGDYMHTGRTYEQIAQLYGLDAQVCQYYIECMLDDWRQMTKASPPYKRPDPEPTLRKRSKDKPKHKRAKTRWYDDEGMLFELGLTRARDLIEIAQGELGAVLGLDIKQVRGVRYWRMYRVRNHTPYMFKDDLAQLVGITSTLLDKYVDTAIGDAVGIERKSVNGAYGVMWRMYQ